MIRIHECILYRNFQQGDILEKMTVLMNIPEGKEGTEEERETLFSCINGLVELAGNYGFSGNLWHNYLTYLLVNHENAFSMACEIRGAVIGSINEAAENDFRIFKEAYDFDLELFDRRYGTSCCSLIKEYENTDEDSKMFNSRIRDRICEMSKTLAAAKTVDEFMEDMVRFYKDFGVGKLGLHKAFRIRHGLDDEVIIEPITRIAHVQLDDLVGYELAKKKLIDNTEAFVRGRKANNCLLFGDAGTGKSSSIKGILNRYYEEGLRIIEVYKHQFQDLNQVIAQIKNRNYKFIIYMDDLSFEEFEIEYKYLKAVIEGGLEKKPDNILIYATSNRRHLVRERAGDKLEIMDKDDLHSSDTVQEKLSLVYRFGVRIYFGAPNKKEFQNIVRVLAKRYGVQMPEEELLLEANKWELSHGGLTGRTAQQFIDYLLGQQG
ncbi:MAG TPA: ATP-binding protein [Candidatus Blautia faecavium]|uniref:ATP-binding protein n=1 Tax=Candidatus Blautia faecavium TaxID=2838487 RepID=A0A9D2RWE1_9FIRM|nr:ATP-binding protein [Candidatus Blautia faecavium]